MGVYSYRSVLCLLFLAASCSLSPVTAMRAQGAGTPPAGTAIVPASLFATALRGSAHLSGTLGLGAPGGPPAITASVTGNGALGGQARAALQIKPSGGGAALLGGASLKVILKGQYLAVRSGRQKWSCTNVATALLSGKLTGLKLPIPGLASISLLSLPMLGAPVDLGPETINGLAVWHVQLKSPPSSAAPTGLDLYINQTNLVLTRIALTTTLPGQTPLGLSLSVDLSQYGKTVKVTLPSVCKAKGKGKSS